MGNRSPPHARHRVRHRIAPVTVRPKTETAVAPPPVGDIRIGISGWRYKGWRGVFYPPKFQQRLELEFASHTFNTIEINGTFYSLQHHTSFERWARETPENFLFSIKGSRFITHMKKLRGIDQAFANLLALGPKLGPILWQFPPQMRFDPDRFRDFFHLLPRTTTDAARLAQRCDDRMLPRSVLEASVDIPPRHTVEIRHESFATPPLSTSSASTTSASSSPTPPTGPSSSTPPPPSSTSASTAPSSSTPATTRTSPLTSGPTASSPGPAAAPPPPTIRTSAPPAASTPTSPPRSPATSSSISTTMPRSTPPSTPKTSAHASTSYSRYARTKTRAPPTLNYPPSTCPAARNPLRIAPCTVPQCPVTSVCSPAKKSVSTTGSAIPREASAPPTAT